MPTYFSVLSVGDRFFIADQSFMRVEDCFIMRDGWEYQYNAVSLDTGEFHGFRNNMEILI